jgi:hypothetical protein
MSASPPRATELLRRDEPPLWASRVTLHCGKPAALDAAGAKLRLFYVRFMDDILILAPTRGRLRGAVKVVNQMLGMLMLEKHPNNPN